MLTGMTEQGLADHTGSFRRRAIEPGRACMMTKFLRQSTISRHNSITWRALPKEFGNWNSVWKRFWRLSRSGVFEAFFQMLVEFSETAHLIQFFDSTTARAHVSPLAQKGGSITRHWALARRIFDQNPSQNRSRRPPSRLPPDPWRSQRQHMQFETSLDIGPDIRPRIAVTDKDMTATQTASLPLHVASHR